MPYSDLERQCYLWEQSYPALLAVLQRHGVDSPTGKGDFWLLDDDYGCPEHLLYVFRLEVLTPCLVADMQSVLRAPAMDGWTIRVTLDLTAPEAATIPAQGLIVSRHAVEEHWNSQALHARFGDTFHFPAGWQAQAGGAGLAPPDISATPDPEFHAAWMAEESHWLREHAELVELLEAHTGEAMSPDAVFQVSDEDRAGPHSVVLKDIRLLTPALADKLSALLRTPYWTTRMIMVALAVRTPCGELLPPQGLMIDRDMIEPLWDAARLKELFGDDFGWPDTPEPSG